MHAGSVRGDGAGLPYRDPRARLALEVVRAACVALLGGCAGTRVPRPPDPPPARSLRIEPLPSPAESRRSDETANEPVEASSSYWIPALEIIGFDVLLNLYDRQFIDEDTYSSDLESIEENLERGFDFDDDPFAVNQIGHPYQGSIYHGFARSAGLGYWTAFGYDVVASAVWEVAGETSQPSLNDQITTPVAGSYLGEALFRMAGLALGKDERPGFWRELGAAAISPPTGFNRLMFDRFDAIRPSADPPYFARVGLGARHNASIEDLDVLEDIPGDTAIGRFAIDYGLPGEPGYEHERPFDYFAFEATLTSSAEALPENVLVRGMLCGTDHRWSDSVRGIWGLYGGYEYISPELFSVSSSSVSLGSTAQWNASDWIALQGTATAGVGWTAVGTIADAREDRNYRFGWSPQGLLELRLLLGKFAALELAGREYHVYPTESELEREDILRGEARITVRLWKRHALAMQIVASRRDANLLELGDTLESTGAVSVLYTYMGDERFGRVQWPD